jgi:hypothetical protein
LNALSCAGGKAKAEGWSEQKRKVRVASKSGSPGGGGG